MTQQSQEKTTMSDSEQNVDPRVQAAHQAYRAQTGSTPDDAPEPTEQPLDAQEAANEETETAHEQPADATEQPEETIEEVVSPTETLEFEIAELKSQLLRALADNDNLHKRIAREKEEASRYAIRQFAQSMVGVGENLIRAMQTVTEESKEQNAELKNLWDGINMTASDLDKALQTHGIIRLFPEAGTAFDHNHHQAISQIESPEHEAGMIVQTVQAGYQMHDRLLQPAMVVVAK